MGRHGGREPAAVGAVAHRPRRALESIARFDIGGLEVTFSPDDHTGLEFADLAVIGEDGRFAR